METLTLTLHKVKDTKNKAVYGTADGTVIQSVYIDKDALGQGAARKGQGRHLGGIEARGRNRHSQPIPGPASLPGFFITKRAAGHFAVPVSPAGRQHTGQERRKSPDHTKSPRGDREEIIRQRDQTIESDCDLREQMKNIATAA